MTWPSQARRPHDLTSYQPAVSIDRGTAVSYYGWSTVVSRIAKCHSHARQLDWQRFAVCWGTEPQRAHNRNPPLLGRHPAGDRVNTMMIDSWHLRRLRPLTEISTPRHSWQSWHLDQQIRISLVSTSRSILFPSFFTNGSRVIFIAKRLYNKDEVTSYALKAFIAPRYQQETHQEMR